jgi:hypothetical protein
MDELKTGERDARFEWCWVEISLHGSNGEIRDFLSRDAGNLALEATLLHLIAKRMPKPHCKPLELYNTLTNRFPQPPQPRPPMPIPRPNIITVTKPGVPGKKSRYVSDSSDSDSDSAWSSDSSKVNVNRTLRKYRSNKLKKERAKKRYGSDSEDSDEEDEAIKIKIELKRGDDVVKTLLEKWTPQNEVEGKGKGKMAA